MKVKPTCRRDVFSKRAHPTEKIIEKKYTGNYLFQKKTLEWLVECSLNCVQVHHRELFSRGSLNKSHYVLPALCTPPEVLPKLLFLHASYHGQLPIQDQGY